MNFIDYINIWAKAEVLQGKLMIGIGILILIVFIFILKSDNQFLRGVLILFALLVVILIGYGSYIIYSRPAHAQQSISLYKTSKTEAISKEIEKHVSDNKAGKLLMSFYPILAILALASLLLGFSQYYKGMAIGFSILFLAFYTIDNGFVSRSDAFIAYLNML